MGRDCNVRCFRAHLEYTATQSPHPYLKPPTLLADSVFRIIVMKIYSSLGDDARVARFLSISNFTSIVLKLYPTTITQYIIRDSSVLVISVVVVANSVVSFVPRSLLVNSFMASRVSGLMLLVSSRRFSGSILLMYRSKPSCSAPALACLSRSTSARNDLISS